MLSKKAQLNIITELLKNRKRSGMGLVRDDHLMDCQLVMPDRSMLAVFDFRDAVLNADRFPAVPDAASKMIMDFDPSDADEVAMVGYNNLINRTKLVSFRYQDAGENPDKRFYLQLKYLQMVDYDPSSHRVFIKVNDDNKPIMFYVWDWRKEEVDAMICPFRIMEDNNDQS